MLGRLILFINMLLIITSALTAKEFDLPTILRLTEENNKDIKLARSNLEFASAQMKEAISTALPKVDLNLNYNRNFLENIFYFTVGGETQSFKASFRNEYRFNATLDQTIFGFGKIGSAIKGIMLLMKIGRR